MSVGIACQAFGYGGGMERYAMDLVNGLTQLGIRPVVFATRFEQSIPEYRCIEPVTIKVRGVPGKLRDHWFDARQNHLKATFGIDLLIACKRTGASDVAICGGTHIGHLRSQGRTGGFWDRQQIALERRHYMNARVVIAHSRLMADELRRDYGVPAERLHVLYPPVDTSKFSPADDAQRRALRARLELPDDKLVFLFPSSGHERKGYPLLADFFERTTLPVMLAVVGRPVCSPSPNIRYLGFRQDIENCYRAADFTILASLYEPFGLVGPESVLCGTPTVLADNIGATEVLDDDSVFTFDRRNPVTLAAAVDRALALHRAGRGRLHPPSSHLRYNPSVRAHVTALLEVARAASLGPA
ncbi:MAG: glycosyltransferase family 4 protein [Pigmentiphaga sp.]|uniref:glycosyltransferase family 4 protein n=1 Tax=Pigmentiphaga sp. TaxID=1977564 RepID=UPI0029B2EF1D|nr:glycosyltransferase family 4 protein [Pigmentiphaga sp.]MDX3904355.1 glycosyltransferase family 4 protein [Pigmentiphaga sp.]